MKLTSPAMMAVHPASVRLFAHLLAAPTTWFAVDDLVVGATVGRATVYRRCANMVSAGVASQRTRARRAEFKLNEHWSSAPLGQRLDQRRRACPNGPGGTNSA